CAVSGDLGRRFAEVTQSENRTEIRASSTRKACGLLFHHPRPSPRYTDYVDSTRFDDDPVQVYLREVAAVPPLTKGQEMELSRQVLANDQQAESAGKILVEANLAMVVSIAERYPRGNMYLL